MTPGTADASSRDLPPPTTATVLLPPARSLTEGAAFGSRYRILKILGSGGMGAVYQAWDNDLGVSVALKVIRPDPRAGPRAAQDLERRLKRELLLARQITHKHVVRIHDFGDVAGVKYLTMPCIEGETLAARLRRDGRLPLGEALDLARQIASGLVAAHEAGVVHRDLKPENVMVDADGQAVIMDFGIARSETGGATLTQSGVVIGTPEYMAPEQAEGQPADHRADVYAFGLILYDLIGGRWRIGRHSTPMSEILARLNTPLPPLRSVAPETPPAVEAIVARCVERDPGRRYQTVAGLLRDLERLDADGHPLPALAAAVPREARGRWTRWAVGAALVAAALGGAYWMTRPGGGGAAPAPREPVSVLVADFDNAAQDPVFDGLIEQALSVGIEGAGFVTVYPRRDARRLAGQIAPGKPLDVEMARLVSIREGIDVILAGSVAQDANRRYRLSVRVLDPDKDTLLLDWDTEAAGKDDILGAVGRMAGRVRRALGDTTVDEARASDAETFTAGSLEAAHAYAAAQELQWAGQFEEAIAGYQEAIRLDPEMGRAYAGIAALYANLGRREDAEANYQLAMSKIDRMTDREKYRTRSGYYLLVRNTGQALEQSQALVDRFPADTAGLANLALAYFYRRDMSRALEEGRRALDIYPKNVIRKNNVALFAMYAGDFETAEREARGVLEINPEFAKALVAIAVSQLATGRVAEARETYGRLGALSAAGRAFATTGLADLALFEGRLTDGAAILEQAMADAAAAGATGAVARHAATLAGVRLAEGRDREALAAADRALAAGREDRVLFEAGRVYLGAGRPDRALEVAAELQARFEQEPQIYGHLLEGEVDLAGGEPRASMEHVGEAQRLADTWLGRFALGRLYLEAGRFTEAHAEFDACLKRRGEATAVYLDDLPTWHLLAPIYYHLGRAQEGLGSPAAAESYRTFLDIKQNGDEQGLVADARRRLEGR